MRPLNPLRRAGLLLLPLALHALPALAHNGYPDTTSLTIRRDHPDDMLLGATFGAVISHDRGQTWSWLCPEALSYGGWRPETYLWQPDGTLLAATGSDLILSKNSGCTWTKHPFFTPERAKDKVLWPIGLASPGSSPSRLWVTTGRSGTKNGLYRSDDGGATFSLTSLSSDTDIYPSVKVAPSDPTRLYVSASTPDGLRIHRSDDDGLTWKTFPQPFSDIPTTSRPYDLFVLKVADHEPDRLWARVTASENSGIWTYILESRDGGQTFRSIVHPLQQEHDGLDEPFINMEVSEDGDTVWAATQTRLFRVRAGETRATMLSLPDGNACAERHDGVLFVCGASRLHDWALATTSDDGDSYTPLFNLPDMKPPACPAGTPGHDVCRSRWPQFAPTIEADPTLPPAGPTPDAGTPDAGEPDPRGPDAGDGPPDAGPGVQNPPPPPKKGCSSTGGGTSLLGLLVLALSRRSRGTHPEHTP